MVKVSTTGLSNKKQAISEFKALWVVPVRSTLKLYGSKMVKSARLDHAFTPRSGNADKSIDFDVPNDRIELTFGITNKIADANWKGLQYTTFLHEGTGRGYKNSRFTKKYSHKTPKTGYGIKADHFLVRAWDRYYKEMLTEINKKLLASAKKAFEG